MPDFKGIENLFLIYVFIVPGIIILYVRARFITGRMPSHAENIVGYVVISLIYYSLLLPILGKFFKISDPKDFPLLGWIGITLVGPCLVGFLLGVLSQKQLLALLVDKLNLFVTHVMPTAWDWRFSSISRGGIFIKVTLTDGSYVWGYFGSTSFASTDSAERDLYLEEEYDFSESEGWQPRPEKIGILIPAKEIRHIEFWEPNSGDTNVR